MEIIFDCDPSSIDKTSTVFVMAVDKVIPLPDGYEYRFIDDHECVVGIAPDKKPILVTLDGVITEIDFDGLTK